MRSSNLYISDTHLEEVRQQGFTIIEDFLEPDLLAAAQSALWDVFPTPEAYFKDPAAYEKLVRHQFAGLKLFPYPSWYINRLAVHPDLVDAAQRFCGTPDLDLYKVELWAKYSGGVDYDQPHHRDYGNHSLVVPKLDDEFVQMTCFILLSDVTELDGPTKVIPQQYSAELPLVPQELALGAFQENEVAITGKAGSLFIYKTDVLHRGSSMLGDERSRFVILVDFQPRGLPWAGKMSWPNHSLSEYWIETMVKMTPRERELFGFPSRQSAYWDMQTIRDVGLRYPNMDMSAYKKS